VGKKEVPNFPHRSKRSWEGCDICPQSTQESDDSERVMLPTQRLNIFQIPKNFFQYQTVRASTKPPGPVPNRVDRYQMAPVPIPMATFGTGWRCSRGGRTSRRRGGGGPHFLVDDVWMARRPRRPRPFCVWCLDVFGDHFRLGSNQQIHPQPERPTAGPPLRFATADGRFCVGFLDGMVLPRTGAKESKSVRREAAFQTIRMALAGEAGKAFKLAFENNAFSLVFFTCRGPPSSCFSARTPPFWSTTHVPQVSDATGAHRTPRRRRTREANRARRARFSTGTSFSPLSALDLPNPAVPRSKSLCPM
jgi:hypothetical protein